MKLPFLASFIILLVVVSRLIRKSNRSMEEEKQAFWAKEREANNVRKKTLDNLNYVSIPLNTLPADCHSENEIIQDCLSTLHALAEEKIVNLTGITNTDLKLTYGTANITALTQYDQNFTFLVSTLQKWADKLYELEAIAEAKTVLEYAVSIESDVTKTYSMLASIYAQNGEQEKIFPLFQSAQNLSSSSGKIIVRKLKEEHPDLVGK